MREVWRAAGRLIDRVRQRKADADFDRLAQLWIMLDPVRNGRALFVRAPKILQWFRKWVDGVRKSAEP